MGSKKEKACKLKSNSTLLLNYSVIFITNVALLPFRFEGHQETNVKIILK